MGLFSGGKDSTFALYEAKSLGHEITCLVTICPDSDESMLFHFPNCKLAKYLGESLNIPSLVFNIKSDTKEEEARYLEKAIIAAMSKHQVEGVVHGTISSRYQKKEIVNICRKLNLVEVSPIWQIDQANYMDMLVERKFEIKIVAVAAMGLDSSWLGVSLDLTSLEFLKRVCRRNGINMTFEGGEAETLVVDCPIYQKKLEICKANIKWDGQRGIFEIQDATLVEKKLC